MNMNVGEPVEWLTRPTPSGYLRGIVVKNTRQKIGIAVQSPKTGEWKPKWVERRYLRIYEISPAEPGQTIWDINV